MRNLLMLLSALALSAGAASASIIFSSDGTATPSFFPNNGSSSTSGVYHAFQFTVGAGQGGTLDELVTGGNTSTAFTEDFAIFTDNADTIGSLIDTIPIATIGDSNGRLYTGTATNHVLLASGSTYWIEATSPTGSNAYLWLESGNLAGGREYSSASGYFDGQPLAAFALVHTDATVPEPGTWVLTLSCLAPMLLRLGRRNSGPGAGI